MWPGTPALYAFGPLGAPRATLHRTPKCTSPRRAVNTHARRRPTSSTSWPPCEAGRDASDHPLPPEPERRASIHSRMTRPARVIGCATRLRLGSGHSALHIGYSNPLVQHYRSKPRTVTTVMPRVAKCYTSPTGYRTAAGSTATRIVGRSMSAWTTHRSPLTAEYEYECVFRGDAPGVRHV
jgi:hypothetical protein